jgi:hypothetical protein
MPNYLVEGYFPRSRAGELTGLIARLRAAADELMAEGVPVRHLRSSFLPVDELFLHLVEAESAEAAGRLTERAGLAQERIAESVQIQ